MNIKAQQFEQMQQINCRKLRQQNIQLYNQIFQLQKQVNEVLTRKEIKKIKNSQLQNQLSELYGEQIQAQQKQIKKLKEQAYYLKSSNAKNNAEYINNEENLLLLLIKERDQLLRERQLIKRKIQDKRDVLNMNSGLDNHKKQLQSQYTTTKRNNQKLSAQITELQRQVRKHHYLVETFKDLDEKKEQPPIMGQNLQLEYQQLINQISKAFREIKQIQDKWKPSIDSLDSQYFQISNQDKEKKKLLEKLLKQFKIYEHRSKGLRDEAEILSDRNRLAKITAMSNSSMGFSNVMHKSSIKHTPKTDFKIMLESEKKQKVKSEYILKELQKIKVKKQSNHSINLSENEFLEKNKTFDRMKVDKINNETKQEKVYQRSATQGELLQKKTKNQTNINKSVKKQSQLKLTKGQQKKLLDKQDNGKQSKLISNKSFEQKIPLRKSEKKIQKSFSFQEKKDDEINKIHKGQKINNSKEKSQKLANEKSEAKYFIKRNQSGSKKVEKVLELKFEKLEQSQSQKSLNKIYQTKKQKNTQKFTFQRPQVLKKSQSINIQKAFNKNDEEKYKFSPKKSQTPTKMQKFTSKKFTQEEKSIKSQIKAKFEKQLKEKIIIKQKPTEDKRQQQQKKKNKSEEKVVSKHVDKFQIRLENKINTVSKQLIEEKSQGQSSKKKNQETEKNESSPVDKNLLKGLNTVEIINEQAQANVQEQQVFKPYLIKRKRPGGALNFQTKNIDQTKEKQNLLDMIEKKSIGVGNEAENH